MEEKGEGREGGKEEERGKEGGKRCIDEPPSSQKIRQLNTAQVDS
jgi:hypothetical protein